MPVALSDSDCWGKHFNITFNSLEMLQEQLSIYFGYAPDRHLRLILEEWRVLKNYTPKCPESDIASVFNSTREQGAGRQN